MNPIELKRSLVQLRLSGMAAVLETRLLQAQSEAMAPIDLISILVSDELAFAASGCWSGATSRLSSVTRTELLDNFDFQFNPKMNRSLVFDLATAAWIGRREDALFLGPSGAVDHAPRPSGTQSSSRAIACCIAKRTSCWRS